MEPAPSLEAAYAHCAAIAKNHYENFSVASLLLPRELRRAFYTLYAYCRHTDDLGDEVRADRLALLEEWERELVRVYGGEPTDPIMVALQDVVRRFGIPDEPFRKLIQANRMDQGRVRFETFDELREYCAHSANPVGRMVLHLLGDTSEVSGRLSDATCTALQLANFWQDVKRDHLAGRVYLPREDMNRFGVTKHDLTMPAASPAFKTLLRFEVGRAQGLFEEGIALVDRVRGRVKLDIALFSKGGMRTLQAIRECDYDVLAERPTVPTSRKLWLVLTTAMRLALGGVYDRKDL